MNDHIFERDPSDPQRKEVPPLLKLALELGPLLVFFLPIRVVSGWLSVFRFWHRSVSRFSLQRPCLWPPL